MSIEQLATISDSSDSNDLSALRLYKELHDKTDSLWRFFIFGTTGILAATITVLWSNVESENIITPTEIDIVCGGIAFIYLILVFMHMIALYYSYVALVWVKENRLTKLDNLELLSGTWTRRLSAGLVLVLHFAAAALVGWLLFKIQKDHSLYSWILLVLPPSLTVLLWASFFVIRPRRFRKEQMKTLAENKNDSSEAFNIQHEMVRLSEDRPNRSAVIAGAWYGMAGLAVANSLSGGLSGGEGFLIGVAIGVGLNQLVLVLEG